MPPRSRCSRSGFEAGDVYAVAVWPSLLNFVINRDFRRAALFLWMMPLPATRSNMLMASPTAVAATGWSPALMANSAFFTKVRAADRYGRFLARRRSATRMRFLADLLLATLIHLSLFVFISKGTPRRGATRTLPRWYQTWGWTSRAAQAPR